MIHPSIHFFKTNQLRHLRRLSHTKKYAGVDQLALASLDLCSCVRTSMGQEEALLAAPATVAFSWEHEQGVLKPPAVGAPDMPVSPKKAPATVFLPWEQEQGMPKPTVKPRGGPEGPRKAQAPTRRLSVPPPPPGRPSTRGVSRAVRPEDDPFLAAYLACTKSTGGRGGDGGKNRTSGAREPWGQGRRRLAWVGLGLGGLSCKRGDGAVVQSMVRLAKLPELDPRDD